MNTNLKERSRRVVAVHRSRRFLPLVLTIATMFCIFTSSVSASMPRALADTPSIIDFGQSSSGRAYVHGHAPTPSAHALFVTKEQSGDCQVKTMRVKDDSITGFATARPAWKLNVPLTWYFMKPVYERDLGVPSPDTKPVGV